MSDAPAPLLPAPYLEMMASGVSVIVASCSPAMVPSVMRAVGSEVGNGGRDITVFVTRSQSAQLLQDIATTGRVSVVFSAPRSHRTVQVKSRHARLRELAPSDLATLLRYRDAMEVEVGAVGFPPVFVHAMLAHRVDDVVAICFSPEQAFDQSPGPNAGASLMPAPPTPGAAP
ncbi:hypothetical protein [Hydrogenophaga sp. OTU3427]|uniref:hypothetical protein n=1 Tax=Hydrogenophaga sp. OTU3427 TaxID=3043856 RepID=UPI00313B8388